MSGNYSSPSPILNTASKNMISFDSRSANYLRSRSHTISNDLNVSSGVSTDIYSTEYAGKYIRGYDASQNAILVIAKLTSTTEAKVLTEAGNVISVGGSLSCPLAFSTYSGDMDYDSQNQKLVACMGGYASVATINASLKTVVFSALTTIFTTGSVRQMMVAYSPEHNRFLFVYWRYNTGLWCRTGHISGGVVVMDSAETQISASLNSISSLVWSKKHHCWIVNSNDTATYIITKSSSSEVLTVIDISSVVIGHVIGILETYNFDIMSKYISADVYGAVFELISEDMYNCVGMSKESGTSGQSKLVCLRGTIISGLSNGTPGDIYYIGGVAIGYWISTTEVKLYDKIL